jgi:CheY-like chemotaxis protein
MLAAEAARKEEPYNRQVSAPRFKLRAPRANRIREMASGASGGERDASRFGGAAADFISSLGRKTSELKPLLAALSADPGSRMRDELRRKLHALGVGARLLHFGVLAQAIAQATRRIDESPTVPRAMLKELETLIHRIPDLAWEKGHSIPPPLEAPARAMPIASIAAPWTALVVGNEALALSLEDDAATFPCEIERTTDLENALELARAVAPDLLVIDIELAGAMELVASITDDVLTGAVPVVALADRLGSGDKLARLMSLGVAKALEKPVSGVTLREACADVVGERSRALPLAMHPEIGEVTVQELATRLRDELDRLLIEQLEPGSRDRKVSLETGAEILGPFWGALARIRDVLRNRSHGGVAFRDDHLRRPIAISPVGTLDGDRRVGRRAGPEVDLEGRTIVVADDDPGIAAYITNALREAGADVKRTGDGESALALTRKHQASAIVTDVLMPKLDGVGLTRALRRDVALRDRPVILLSWKEDLLQRLRDLRIGTSGTLKKDDDAATIVNRVREVLAPRVRIEARIAGGAEVRGRLDDLTVASLLSITNSVRKEACVIVRDAAHVFEVELNDGGIRRVTRTGVDGTFVRGPQVIPSLLGVIGGRFLVRPVPGPIEDPLRGELDQQLEPILFQLRAACDAVSGVATIELAAVGLDPTMLKSYLPSTPAPVRRVLEKLADGASPRTMILAGEVAPAILEDVLVDAASRGLVVRAVSVKGVDLLARAAAQLDADLPPPSSRPHAPESLAPTPIEFSLESMAPPPKPATMPPESDTPGSLADAVLASTGTASVPKPPIIDTRELKPRSTRSDPPGYSATPTPAPFKPAPSQPRVETLGGGVVVSKDPTLPPPEREPKQ